MVFNYKKWLNIALINLLLVTLLGVIMRYKIGFDFPYLHQKHLQHAHSHFAFSGWIGHTLMVLLIRFLAIKTPQFYFKKYEKLLWVNLISSYGMLLFFTLQGYASLSIFFSTLSIVVAYYFAILFWRDSQKLNSIAVHWFKGALFFNVISSLGTFALAYMMMSKNIHQELYLAAIYYYLHFQYNGWFFFVCAGLLMDYMNSKGIYFSKNKLWFRLFFTACIPAYFLSVLWLKLPVSVFVLTVLSAFVQLVVWLLFLQQIKKYKNIIVNDNNRILRNLYWFLGFAISVKLLLQLGSTIPEVSHFAFGFRPIVIAYLHLVLLAIISLYLLFYIYNNTLLPLSNSALQGLVVFFLGVLLNELVLGLQGVLSLAYIPIPYVNEILFGIALMLLSGIFLQIMAMKKDKKKCDYDFTHKKT